MRSSRGLAVVIGQEEALSLSLARRLAALGFDSILMADEEDGLTEVVRLAPSLVVMARADTGEATIAALARAVEAGAAACGPVFLCVGEGDSGGLGRAVAEGAAECLVAPFDADLLKFKLELSGVI